VKERKRARVRERKREKERERKREREGLKKTPKKKKEGKVFFWIFCFVAGRGHVSNE